jgi:hypothetical protein
MEINCGRYGSLTIFVCEGCSSKFEPEEKKREPLGTYTSSNDLCKKTKDWINGNSEENEKQIQICSTNIINSSTTVPRTSEKDPHNKSKLTLGIEEAHNSKFTHRRTNKR